MSRIVSTIAAAVAASPLLIAEPSQAKQPAAPDPIVSSERCQLYSNTLKIMGEMHVTGSLTLTPKELALEGARGILTAGHIKIVTHTADPTKASSTLNFSADNKNVVSWTLKGTTIEIPEPPATIQTYAGSCAYLNSIAIKVQQASGAPLYDLFEAATASATEGAVPKDHHSGYMPRKQAEDMRARTQGEFGGLGLEMRKTIGEPAVVQKIMKGNPAEKGGLLAGDKITHINGASALPLTIEEVANTLRGAKNSKVTIRIVRGEAKPFDVTLTRDTIVKYSVEGYLLKGTEIGVLKISTFSENTLKQLLETAVNLTKEAHEMGISIKHFTIRVENNPGGLLDQAEKLSDLFVDSTPEVARRLVSTGKSPTNLKTTTFAEQVLPFNLYEYLKQAAPEGVVISPFSVSVLQNGGSASASEILAGAAQDAGFAVIGTRSYGKGTVQTIVPLTRSGTVAKTQDAVYGSLRVTTAAFFPGSGPVKPSKLGSFVTLPEGFKLPGVAGVGLSNLGSGIVPNILVLTGDERDGIERDRPKEEPGLLDPGLTRAKEKPRYVCTVREAYRGALSAQAIEDIPEQLIISATTKDKTTGEPKDIKLLDANLACDVEGHYKIEPSLVEIGDYKDPQAAGIALPDGPRPNL